MRLPNRYAAAIKENANLIGLASATALSLALLNPLPLLGAIVLEAAYLVFVPDSKWYEARLERRFDQEVKARREKLKGEILPNVRYSVRDRFQRLEEKRYQIETQTKSEDKWFREALRKLDYLMERYLEFSEREEWFAKYLDSISKDLKTQPPKITEFKRVRGDSDSIGGNEKSEARTMINFEITKSWIENTVERIQDGYQGEIDGIRDHLAGDPDFPTVRLEEKRIEILERRRNYVDRIGMILHNLGAQMRLIQDTFGLINDEIRARSPEQVLADIDEVVLASNSLAEAIDSVASLEDLVKNLGN